MLTHSLLFHTSAGTWAEDIAPASTAPVPSKGCAKASLFLTLLRVYYHPSAAVPLAESPFVVPSFSVLEHALSNLYRIVRGGGT